MPSIPTPRAVRLVLIVCCVLPGCRSGSASRDSAVSASPSAGLEANAAAAKPLPAVFPPMALVAGTTYEAAGALALPEPASEDGPALHNVFHLSENVVSGSEPHGEEAFRILQAKGIHTILSVDGKVPDAEMAARYGMKYVHVPIQYKGITDEEILRITKTFREQQGPFYVHCFHGKHRGPAAAELGRLVLDGIPREQALAEMRQWCGTSPSYEGLYATIAYTDLPTDGETRELDWNFPAAQPLEGVAGAMVQIARANEHLDAASENGWQPPADHPDLNAPNEAAKLADLFQRTLDLDALAAKPEDFRGWMRDAAAQAAALRDAVLALEPGGPVEAADRGYEALSQTCSACHRAYRN